MTVLIAILYIREGLATPFYIFLNQRYVKKMLDLLLVRPRSGLMCVLSALRATSVSAPSSQAYCHVYSSGEIRRQQRVGRSGNSLESR